MAAVLAVVPAGDLDTSRSDLEIGIEYVCQKIKQVLLFVKGEWFLDLNQGTPWFEDILVKGANAEVVKGILRKRILTVPEVAAVPAMSVTLDTANRLITVTFTAKLKTGAVLTDTTELGV